MSSVSAEPRSGPALWERALDTLEAESSAVFGDRQRIEDACAALRAESGRFGDPDVAARLLRLAHGVARKLATGNAPIIALLCEAAETVVDPWPLLGALLESHDDGVVAGALAALGRAAAVHPRLLDERLLEGLAECLERGGPLADRESLETLAALFDSFPGPKLEALFTAGPTLRIRRFAARLLDLATPVASPTLARELLGPEDATFAFPYLAWTRATHLDLLALASGRRAAVLDSLRRAEEHCGARLLREIIGEIGWQRLNYGVSVRRVTGTSVGGSFPLMLDAAESALLEGLPHSRLIFDRVLVVAHGGLAPEARSAQQSAIGRFREYNLAHADLLADFLDIAPLTVAKAKDLLSRMRRMVDDFQRLFSAYTDECTTLQAVFGELESSIARALAAEPSIPGRPVSAELTRLVNMFEDPDSVASVHTLHGLKRYLHQRGLKLGMRLAEAVGSANRTVTLVVAATDRVLAASHAVEWADFEPGEPGDAPPYAVRVLVDEFARQLVHALQPLPKVKVFCYGNEVHYFIAFRNHPALVRVDYSPPARGGMIELAYFGVSKFELGAHPNPSLTALDRVFRVLDFDVQIESTHVRARYDKERAFDLGDLCAKAASLFRLAPYLMKLDWVIGDLALSASARDEVAAGWGGFFAEWGILPYAQFLTRDRRGILAAVDPSAAGAREVRWDGCTPYRDRFCGSSAAAFRDHVREALAARGLDRVVGVDPEVPIAQLPFERLVLEPLRDATARGELEPAATGLAAAPPETFQSRHPAECFAQVLLSGGHAVARAARVADLLAMFARSVRFATAGSVNGYEVQRAVLPLAGSTLSLCVLRDGTGIGRLGLWAPGESLFARRDEGESAWRENWSTDAEALEKRLRRANYPMRGVASPDEDEAVARRIVEIFSGENPHASSPPLPGERVLEGIAASPGRAVGLARLGLENRRPADVEGGVIVCPAMTPDDGVFLRASAGVVSTGGGALSHAALLALQHRKPALVVSGAWERSGGSISTFLYRTVCYDERRRELGGYVVVERHDVRERTERLREGDLIVLDGDAGELRVLGQEAAALALHDTLRQLAAATRRLAVAGSDPEILAERGRQLRARHQLGKVIDRLGDPILARFAVTELLLGPNGESAALERGSLLALAVSNPRIGEEARAAIRLLTGTLRRRLAASLDEATRIIHLSRDAWEVLALRLRVLELEGAAGAARATIAASGVAGDTVETPRADLDALARRRLEGLHRELAGQAERAAASGDSSRARHLLGELDRIARVAGIGDGGRPRVDRLRTSIAARDGAVLRRHADDRILDASAGGIELRPFVGSKAANLAELARLGEVELVPPWFVVTERAFREAFASPLSEGSHPSLRAASVRAAVETTLARPDLTNAQKASLIREAWEAALIPDRLIAEVREAYRALGAASGEPGDPFVAVRSSAREEDLELAARAGEFDTFLFIRGADSLVMHLKRAWAGFWTERALHSRVLLGSTEEVGGGILVQRMVASRASGVLHTVNVGERRLREMVISAGLGVGEGIVSGIVAADTIVVSKETPAAGDLRFRYLTADKRKRVVFNSRVGSGTALVDTLHHQRLRPALEYVEIFELVKAAARLEAAYRYPLDIEFAVEGTSLFLLQVRPIPAPFAAWRDTLERWPLALEPGGAWAPARLEEDP